MVACRIVPVVLSLLLASYSIAQNGSPRQQEQAALPPESLSFGEVSSVPVPSLPAESIEAPLLCDKQGRILFRLATPEAGVEDPVSVSSDGKTVVRFAREKMNDITHPVILSVFFADSDVYLLTRGSTPLGYRTKWRTPTGEVIEQQASKSSTFVAHFMPDGSYAGAVVLDVPFQAMRLGVFENGDFLIAGAEPTSEEPRVAIVASNGQLRRLLELKGDVHARQNSGTSQESSDPTALPRMVPAPGDLPMSSFAETLMVVVSTSQVVRDGRNLLLIRPVRAPVFSISPSGEISVHKLKIDGDYTLYTIKPDGDLWIVEFLRNVPNSEAVELSTYAFDPESGLPLRKYLLAPDAGWGLACADSDTLTFVAADEKTNSLKIVKLAAGAGAN